MFVSTVLRIILFLVLVLFIETTVSSPVFTSGTTSDLWMRSLDGQIEELLANLLRTVQYQLNHTMHKLTHILALETNKTLAIIEIHQTPDSINQPLTIRLIDCALFDMIKRKLEGKQFMKIYAKPQANVFFFHYNVNYSTVLEVSRMCRLLWKHQSNLQINEQSENTLSIISSNKPILTSILESIKGDAFIAPFTKWCGKGDKADTYWDLDVEAEVDSCCREHDHCPIRLASGEQNYGHINLKSLTISLCECDRRFEECLQQSHSDYASKISWFYFRLFDPTCLEQVDCRGKRSNVRMNTMNDSNCRLQFRLRGYSDSD